MKKLLEKDMKTIIIVSLFILGTLGVYRAIHAYNPNLDYRDLGSFDVGNIDLHVTRFVDPDNGNVCYLAAAIYKGGISCLKP